MEAWGRELFEKAGSTRTLPPTDPLPQKLRLAGRRRGGSPGVREAEAREQGEGSLTGIRACSGHSCPGVPGKGRRPLPLPCIQSRKKAQRKARNRRFRAFPCPENARYPARSIPFRIKPAYCLKKAFVPPLLSPGAHPGDGCEGPACAPPFPPSPLLNLIGG